MAASRRCFLASAGAAALGCLCGPTAVARAAQELALAPGLAGVKLSPFYEPLADGRVRCTLCPQGCEVGPGERGACRVRENRGGRYYSLVYGNPCAVHLDPIEKKPFFHVLPGSGSLSLATAGCNFSCRFCQNWEISQKGPEETINVRLSPARAASEARRVGAASIASTYVEPTIFMEYMLDLGAEAHKVGLLKVMHSNGYVNPGPLGQLIKVLDAACIDLKSAREHYYSKVCGGSLEPVRATLRALVKAKVHTEIVHLMVTGLNDSPAETRELVGFVHDELSPEVPLHLTRFYPRYQLKNLPPTPLEVLQRARATALDMGMKYVYIGNAPGLGGEDTVCPSCKAMLVQRRGYMVMGNNIKQGKCPKCGRGIPGIWDREA